MSDTYIDPSETQIYGLFAREQLAEVCLGRVPALDGAVSFAIQTQTAADLAMKQALHEHPAAPVVDVAEALDQARDVVVRFGAYLGSLKGRPLDPSRFFGRDAPSVLARRRLTKLVGGVAHIADEVEQQKAAFPGLEPWFVELSEVLDKLRVAEKQQRAKRVERVDVGPELEAARQAWLRVYGANKVLIRGVLTHAGRPELLPLVFDDLAETHRAVGVTDDAPPTPEPEPPTGG